MDYCKLCYKKDPWLLKMLLLTTKRERVHTYQTNIYVMYQYVTCRNKPRQRKVMFYFARNLTSDLLNTKYATYYHFQTKK